MGSKITKAIKQTTVLNTNENKIPEKIDNLTYPLTEIVCTKTHDLQNPDLQDYKYCYVCKLENKITMVCKNCNLSHNPNDYYKYCEICNKCYNQSFHNINSQSNLVCHKCFYIHCDKV